MRWIWQIKKYENSSQGQRLRSNVINFQSFLAFSMGHIPTKWHQFLPSSFGDFVRTDTQPDRQTPPRTIPICSRRAAINFMTRRVVYSFLSLETSLVAMWVCMNPVLPVEPETIALCSAVWRVYCCAVRSVSCRTANAETQLWADATVQSGVVCLAQPR